MLWIKVTVTSRWPGGGWPGGGWPGGVVVRASDS